jgi:CheY-like chemotaxis protein/anti-sigma regulatory factor (Ser/Thr protein kinase)
VKIEADALSALSATLAEHRVLIVDDQRQAQVLLARFLKRMGYAVEVASNGVEAVEAVARSRPDVVIMDVEMPLMSGFEATERIREMPGRWLPIVFLSATPDSAALIRALEKGGDDYLVKPIGYSVLRAKMRAVSRTLMLQRELELRNARLDAYRAAEEEQNRAAEHVIRRLAGQELLEQPVMQHWTAPANLFSGDLVAAARTPTGVLHVMLADGAGHGLAAALTALPVTQPFYRMSEKGYPLSRIVEEINRKIRNLLPVERFVAATFMAIDFEDQLVESWNGGNPPLCVIGSQGRLLHVGGSRNLALGVAPERLFRSETEIYRFEEPCQIIACSDGLFEAAGWNAAESGVRLLAELVAGHDAHARLEALKARCESVRAGAPAGDDVSAVAIACIPGAPVDCPPVKKGAGHVTECDVSVAFSAEQLKDIDAVPLLNDLVRRLHIGAAADPKLFVVLSELVTNALDHGLLGLDSRCKRDPQGFQRYATLRKERLAALASGRIEVRIASALRDGRAVLSIAVRDTGPGFDHTRVLDSPPGAGEPFGRGIPLLRSLCEAVEYHGCGNSVEVMFAAAEPGDAAAG